MDSQIMSQPIIRSKRKTEANNTKFNRHIVNLCINDSKECGKKKKKVRYYISIF